MRFYFACLCADDVEDCVQPGEQTEERVRYRSDGVCSAEFQPRQRSNGGRWSDWDATNRAGEAVAVEADLESCVETQERFKYISVDNQCVERRSIRFREGSPSGEAGFSIWSAMDDC